MGNEDLEKGRGVMATGISCNDNDLWVSVQCRQAINGHCPTTR